MLGNNRSASKKKTEKCGFTLELKPMPEIALLDPITGALPKNYKKILADKERNSIFPNNSKNQLGLEFQKNTHNDSFKAQLKPMPEIALLDPITGLLPKNYKEILAQSAGKAVKLGSTRKSKDLEFKISKLETSDKRLSKIGQTLQINTKKGPRKALFTRPRTPSLTSKGGNFPKPTKTLSTEINESVLLDADETEKQIFSQKKRQIASTIHKPQVFNQTNNNRKRSATSTSSLEEFLKLERETKTPKSAIKSKRRKDMSLAESMDVIMTKLNENNNLMKSIEKNNIEINNNMQKILHSLQDINNKDVHSTKNGTGKLTENIPLISPNEFTSKTNLLVTTLKSNFQKKVLFDIASDENHSPHIKKKTISVTKTVQQTPNTMFRNVSKKADEQLLKLQDTPKSAFFYL
ncbi:hypothetical protein QE152_g9558 [Popillia japonica]|uniref:Uncharacterized protein n=1 Tax=Popillia japonica TaxID=7064 RepID=A0AAW1LY76_POPJA